MHDKGQCQLYCSMPGSNTATTITQHLACPLKVLLYSLLGPADWRHSFQVTQVAEFVSQLHKLGLVAARRGVKDLQGSNHTLNCFVIKVDRKSSVQHLI